MREREKDRARLEAAITFSARRMLFVSVFIVAVCLLFDFGEQKIKNGGGGGRERGIREKVETKCKLMTFSLFDWPSAKPNLERGENTRKH